MGLKRSIGIVTAALAFVAMAAMTPRLTAPVRAPRETGAVKAINTIHTAEVQFYSSCHRFAGSMQELGPQAAGLIESDLASGGKAGYKLTLALTPAGYAISAAPSQYGTSGSKTYFSDQSMGIHMHNGPEPATADDPLLGESAPAQREKR